MDARQILTSRIGEVLHYIWDPIGVADQPGARDEYDSYLPEVVRLALLHDRERLIGYLEHTATNTIGMAQDRTHTEVVAEIILDWKTYLIDEDRA